MKKKENNGKEDIKLSLSAFNTGLSMQKTSKNWPNKKPVEFVRDYITKFQDIRLKKIKSWLLFYISTLSPQNEMLMYKSKLYVQDLWGKLHILKKKRSKKTQLLKISVLPGPIYRFSAVPIQMPEFCGSW